MRHWHESQQSSAAPFPFTGTRLRGGFLRRFASMLTKGRGTRTPATDITAAFNSLRALGVRSEDARALISLALASSCTGPTSCTSVTVIRGESGEPPERADCDHDDQHHDHGEQLHLYPQTAWRQAVRRFAEEKAIMRRRLKFAQGRVGERWEQAGRFRKRHPNDCGNPGCGVCHPERRGRPLPTKAEALRDQVSDA